MRLTSEERLKFLELCKSGRSEIIPISWLESVLAEANTAELVAKALEWYADEKNHNELKMDKFVPYTAIDQDEGNRARQALKGVGNEQSN